MVQIKPVSDLRNKYSEIEQLVDEGNPVFLTKNGYGKMVVMSIEKYSELTDPIESALDYADAYAEKTDVRMSHEDVFEELKEDNGTHDLADSLIEDRSNNPGIGYDGASDNSWNNATFLEKELYETCTPKNG